MADVIERQHEGKHREGRNETDRKVDTEDRQRTTCIKQIWHRESTKTKEMREKVKDRDRESLRFDRERQGRNSNRTVFLVSRSRFLYQYNGIYGTVLTLHEGCFPGYKPPSVFGDRGRRYTDTEAIRVRSCYRNFRLATQRLGFPLILNKENQGNSTKEAQLKQILKKEKATRKQT